MSGAGCFSRDPIRLDSPDPGSKIPAIRKAVQQDDMAASAQLVNDLESDDPAVRFYAIRGLRELTGKDLGYNYYADEAKREPAVKRWNDWLASEKRDASAAVTRARRGS